MQTFDLKDLGLYHLKNFPNDFKEIMETMDQYIPKTRSQMSKHLWSVMNTVFSVKVRKRLPARINFLHPFALYAAASMMRYRDNVIELPSGKRI